MLMITKLRDHGVRILIASLTLMVIGTGCDQQQTSDVRPTSPAAPEIRMDEPEIQVYSSYPEQGNYRVRVVPGESVTLVYPVETPAEGDFIGVQMTFPTVAGQSYRLSASINDAHAGNHPGRFEQQVYVQDQLIWRHDIGEGDFIGERDVNETFVAQAENTTIRFEVRAVGPIDPWGWAAAARTQITGIELESVR